MDKTDEILNKIYSILDYKPTDEEKVTFLKEFKNSSLITEKTNTNQKTYATGYFCISKEKEAHPFFKEMNPSFIKKITPNDKYMEFNNLVNSYKNLTADNINKYNCIFNSIFYQKIIEKNNISSLETIDNYVIEN